MGKESSISLNLMDIFLCGCADIPKLLSMGAELLRKLSTRQISVSQYVKIAVSQSKTL
jgi:hypothetical protein